MTGFTFFALPRVTYIKYEHFIHEKQSRRTVVLIHQLLVRSTH